MKKRHCSNTSGVYQPGQQGNTVMHQSYQQSQLQIAQSVFPPQEVYQPSYGSGQRANMTPSQFHGYNNQVNSAQWSQNNIMATNQIYQTGQQSFQTPQQNYLPAYTAVPSSFQSNPATQQSAQNYYSRKNSFAYPYVQNFNTQQTQTAMSSNSHNFPQPQYGPSSLYQPNVNQWTPPTRGQLQ